MLRFLSLLGGLGALVAASPVLAAASSFDLAGPRLEVSVLHDGVTLPLERVPNLAEGDRISIKLDPLPGHSEHYRLIAVFLRGAVDRPDKRSFSEALSWKPNDASLSLVVPKDAQQMALFLMPERGGGAGSIVAAVRKQPGAFVRAVQELNQASLDRARLDTYVRETQRAEHKSPETLATVSPILTRSLSLKLKAECLQQPVETQSACLTGDRETLLLADTHSSALADTLAGAPTDLAFQLSATPQAGYGSYSSYIGVVRDVFRLFGAFQSTQLQFIPALSQMSDGRVSVLLNTPVSFAKPTSVMVVALPAIEAPKPPPLRRSAPADALLCATAGLVLPVEGAPLIYATGYAHDMTLRLKRLDGTQAELPLRADPSVGGFVADGAIPFGPFGPLIAAQLHGAWGFSSFDGPSFQLSKPGDGSWKATDRTALVVGRSNDLELVGGSAGCVTRVAMRRGDAPPEPLTWKQSGANGIVATVPLDQADPGPVSILIEAKGAGPAEVTLRALQQAGSVDELSLHAGDDQATLTGTRLDQVVSVTLGGVSFQPGALARVGKQDRVTLQAGDAAGAQALSAGTTATADITFVGGRHKSLAVTVAPRRVAATLIRVTAQSPLREGVVPITLTSPDIFAQDARLTFAFRLNDQTALSGHEAIEIATVDGRASTMIEAGKGYDLQDAKTGIVSLNPAEALGSTVYGSLRFRVVSDGAASTWTPLGMVVRLPEIHTVSCAARKVCKIVGNRFFLIEAVATTADFQPSQSIPDGFVATEIVTRPSPDGHVFLRLRDAPQAVAVVGAP